MVNCSWYRVKKFLVSFCKWGLKTRTITNKAVPFEGYPAPVWKNATPRCYLFLSIWSFLLALVMTLMLALDMDDEVVCDYNFRPLLVVQIVFMFLDCLQEIWFFTKSYATDQNWSRYLVMLSATFAVLVSIGIASMIIGFSESGKVTTLCPDGPEKHGLWKLNLAMSINVFVYSLVKVGIIIYSAFKFYRGTSHLAFYVPKTLEITTAPPK